MDYRYILVSFSPFLCLRLLLLFCFIVVIGVFLNFLSWQQLLVVRLPGFVSSIVPFVRAKDLKNDLNARFRDVHSDLAPNLTLSKIRSVKAKLLEVGKNVVCFFSLIFCLFPPDSFSLRLLLISCAHAPHRIWNCRPLQ